MELTILTPIGKIFQGEVQQVTLPGVSGRFTVLDHHAALITALCEGTIIYHTNDRVKELKIKNGFVEVNHNKISVCAEQ